MRRARAFRDRPPPWTLASLAVLLVTVACGAACTAPSRGPDAAGESPAREAGVRDEPGAAEPTDSSRAPREPSSGQAAGARLVRAERRLMGTLFRASVMSADEARARSALEAALDEVARVEQPLSEWRETSEISSVNRRAGGAPVPVGPELLDVLQRARRVSEITDGAFDVTFAACGKLWSIRERRIPSEERLAACRSLVDWRRVEVDGQASTVRLPEAGMRLGIAGIGKGWGVDRAAQVLRSRGFDDFLVDGGGDLRVSGEGPSGPWRVGIRHPRRPGELLGRVGVDHGAIVTSGDYLNSFERGGVRYHHLMDPSTGRPARASVAVTVIAPEATEADALATGFFVLGADRALPIAEELPDVEALIVTPELRVRCTSGFPECAALEEVLE